MMENESIKYLGERLDNFLDELQVKMDDFISKFSNLYKKTTVNESNKALTTSELDIYDFSKLKITKAQFIKKIRNILERAQHKVVVITPTITDLEDLEVYNVRSSINLNIGCFIDIEMDRHEELLEELKSFRNIQIRNYEDQDRWVVLRDGEELLCAVIGAKQDNFLFFQTEDPNHIKLFSNLAMDAWLRSKKI